MRFVRRPLTAAAALVLLSAAPSAQPQTAAPDWSLPQLMAALHQVPASTARFVETRYLHLLNQAQRSSGRLIYIAPDRLQKATIEPIPARLTIAGDRLTIERQGEQNRTISLQDSSQIGALVESIRATLAGDLPALTAHFTTALAGNANVWTLTLTPRDARLRELVTTIRISGERTAIREIETMEPDGDRTDMAIAPEPK